MICRYVRAHSTGLNLVTYVFFKKAYFEFVVQKGEFPLFFSTLKSCIL